MATLREYTGNNTVENISLGVNGYPTEGEITFLLAATINEGLGGGPIRVNPPDHPTVADLLQTPLTILGYTSTEATDGRIFRILPFRHPLYGRLFAYKCDCRSFSEDMHKPQKDVNINADTNSSGPFALHENYLYQVKYHVPKYAILANRKIKTYTLSWTDYDGTHRITPNLANEYLRYTDILVLDREDIISATVGIGSKFRTGSGSAPNNVQFSAQTTQIVWYDVPYRYWTSTNSYLKKLNGRINQFAFLDWGPGELLYQGTTFERYDKPLDDPEDEADVLPTQDSLNFNKLATFAMTFIAAEGRLGVDLPPQPANNNFVIGGHNLQPWLQSPGRYYYVSNNDADQSPNFLSVPFDFLFADPDIVEIT